MLTLTLNERFNIDGGYIGETVIYYIIVYISIVFIINFLALAEDRD